MSVQNSIRTTFEQKIAEIKSRLEAKLRDDLPDSENIGSHVNDIDPASLMDGYLSSHELKPPE